MIFSLGPDALSYDTRQVAAGLDVVREFYDRQQSQSCSEFDPGRVKEVSASSFIVASHPVPDAWGKLLTVIHNRMSTQRLISPYRNE
jgi:hypothetical protein